MRIMTKTASCLNFERVAPLYTAAKEGYRIKPALADDKSRQCASPSLQRMVYELRGKKKGVSAVWILGPHQKPGVH